jgi:flagellar basal-body rod modification protein FlgD
MATVQATSSPSNVFSAVNAGASGAAAVPDEESRFLKLLVTQLKNQDPLNPMDNAQMTSQIAQINTVSGIAKVNTTLGTLLDSFNSSQAVQSTGMIGKSVLVAGSQLSLANGQAVGGVKLDGPADQVTVNILNAGGKVLQTQDLGAREAGNLNFSWDGKNDAGESSADGAYRFSVTATQGGKEVTADPLQVGTVSALVRANSGFLLDLGALGKIDLKNVQQIL